MTNLFMAPAKARKSFLDRIFETVGHVAGPANRIRWHLELFTVIHPIETAQRLWHHLNPRVYSERLRINNLSEGRRPSKGNRYVLFVLFARHAIPAFTKTILDAIDRSPLNLVISTNAEITPELREELLDRSLLLIERADLGRDFGGYKDGISIIEQRFGTPERLILLNDSLFYFDRGLDLLLKELDGPEELVSMTEVFEFHYHLGSFAISFGESVLKNKRFRRYWKKYRPISTRRWAIHKGEVGLSRMLMRAGFRPKVIYHGAQLLPVLDRQHASEHLETVRLLPHDFRQIFYAEFEEIHATQVRYSLTAIGALSKSIQRIDSGDDEPMFSDLKAANVRELLKINHLATSTQLDRETWILKSLGHRIVRSIVKRNQMHVGGFLFMKYLGMPAIKRDIYFREVFRLDEVEDILEQLDEPLRDAVAADMRVKGSQAYLFGLPKLLAKHGSI